MQTTKTSVHGAINMLGLAKRLKCRIFQASRSEVYGDPVVHLQNWGNEFFDFAAPYGVTHFRMRSATKSELS